MEITTKPTLPQYFPLFPINSGNSNRRCILASCIADFGVCSTVSEKLSSSAIRNILIDTQQKYGMLESEHKPSDTRYVEKGRRGYTRSNIAP